ncbi:hypothetical protein [Stutzerimonas zhaodongensis]|uniref:hypothetical protein n=1 Tax=Stutzerimonas TaxID=2901164 RepID=UPI003890F08E
MAFDAWTEWAGVMAATQRGSLDALRLYEGHRASASLGAASAVTPLGDGRGVSSQRCELQAGRRLPNMLETIDPMSGLLGVACVAQL